MALQTVSEAFKALKSHKTLKLFVWYKVLVFFFDTSPNLRVFLVATEAFEIYQMQNYSAN